ncbi:hypothetical protein F5146DRAFT_1054280 [Armillaria mellea]|nr:hypothetical protein F5146DRAFT_1054280 [Armillaria mellea]
MTKLVALAPWILSVRQSSVVVSKLISYIAPMIATLPTDDELAPTDSQEDLDTLATVASVRSSLKLRLKAPGTASIDVNPNIPPKATDSKKQPTKKTRIVPPTDSLTATDAGTKSSATVGEPSGAPSAKAATATKTRKPKLYIVPAAINAKNVCGREWLSKNPGGSKDDYDTYYGNLTIAELNVSVLIFTITFLTMIS